MKASTVLATVVSMAVAASAVPTADSKLEARTDKPVGDICSANQVVSCCNGSNKQTSAGLLSGLIGPILSNSCTGLGVDILALLNGKSGSEVCGPDNSVKCCSGDNSGLIVVDLDILQCSDVL